MRQPSLLRRIGTAGALALSLTGLSAAVEGARAMPAALVPLQAGTAGTLDTVQYGYGHSPRYERSYRSYRRHGRAGLYDCGPGAHKTHMQRRVCR